MKHLVFGAFLTLAGCQCEPAPFGLSDSGMSVAVKQQAFQGTLLGKVWGAGHAVAYFNGASKPFVIIQENPATCPPSSNRSVGERWLLLQPAWKADTAFDFDIFGETAALVVQQANNETKNHLITQGRLEVVSVAAQGGTGKIRLRATLQSETVEGEVDVRVCDNPP